MANPAPRSPRPIHLKQRHIDLLLTLDRTRHLGQAAEALHMSQPAASKSLAQLESLFGYALFERTGSGTQATELGHAAIAHARNMDGAARRFGAELEALRQRGQQQLRIGILPSASIHITPRLITALLSRAGNLEISVHEGLLHDLLASLLERQLDCVIGRTTSRIDSSQIEGRFLYEDPIALVCGVQNPLGALPTPALAEIMGSMWILPVQNSVLSDRMDEMFARLGVERPARHIQSNAVLTNITLINQYPWIAALPRVIAEHFQKQGGLCILPIDTRINFGNVQVMTRKESSVSQPLALALAALRELFPATETSPG
ncbi:LysR family transcriptional regulator [Candidimonas nitroreducens]|nr:LysR substrate-binding domain-containing protein [Candidimonas nitroreducens]